jgi:hypothetical protein
MCVLIFSTTFVWNVFYFKNKWARYNKIYIGLHEKYPVFLPDFSNTLIFASDFQKILKIQFSRKSF